MSLNLIKEFSQLKEKEKFDFLTRFIEACFFYTLAVLLFNNNSISFCYSYIAAEVLF